jgi:5-methylcytosine-specific restriction endonuclease McrA
MTQTTCAVDGCERPTRARGWCHLHWNRWRRCGDVQADRPVRPRAANGSSGTSCQVPGCDEPFFARRCCKVHYSYLQRGRRFDDLRRLRETSYRGGEPCSVAGCERLTNASGLCSTHLSRKRRRGTTADPTPRSAEEIEDSQKRRRDYIRRWKAEEYQRDRDRVLARRRVWLENNASVMKLHDAKKRRKRRGLIVASRVPFTVQQLDAKIRYWGSRCWICTGPYDSIDHVKPVTKGGPHMLANLRPICRPCNSRKSNRWPYQIPIGA